MRNPVRSEADAFHIVVGSGVVVIAAVALGALTTPVAGVALLVGAVAGALIWEFRTQDPERRQPLKEAHDQGRFDRAEGRTRVLVVANRTLTSDALRAEILHRAEAGSDVHVVAPILCSRVHYMASDIDRELRDARERLADALDHLREQGVEVSGSVGDPNVALGAIEDELRRGGADEVLISTHPPKQSNWLETGIVTRLRDELDIPVTHLVVESVPAL
jgi:alkanesulfonate monooxygenase SsuD/methylene tetrahydromethanopterin reductase-like flavin-dependent oxidoreductase (luciferase family)